MTPTRLAFTHISRRAWPGGFAYLRNLFIALAAHQPGRFAPIVFAGSRDAEDELDDLRTVSGVKVVRSDAFDQRRSSAIATLITGLDAPAATAFQAQDVDVVVETANFFGWRLPFPAIAWLPDFQHRRRPSLFSRRAWLRREIGFRMQMTAGRTLMLSSNDARADCAHFYPKFGSSGRVVRFAVRPDFEMARLTPEATMAAHALEQPFFFLPNQFWLHKNHQLVIDALARLGERRIEAVVVATGPPDPRSKQHLDAILRAAAERGLSKSFRYLGVVSRGEVYSLLRTSVALLNPSRFEGWSTTVEEAKSFGVPMLLSDIAVHREQAAAAEFFPVDDPEALSRLLEQKVREWRPTAARQLGSDVETRVEQFASDFATVVNVALNRWRPRAGILAVV